MPAYIEFPYNQSNLLPTASNVGKVVLSVSASNDVYIKDHDGNITIVGGSLQSALEKGNTAATNIEMINDSSIVIDPTSNSSIYFYDPITGNSLQVQAQVPTGSNTIKFPNASGTIITTINGYTPNASGSVTIPTGSFSGSYTGSFIGTLTGTASFATRATSAASADFVTLAAGPGIDVNGLQITASVRSVNGVFPTLGNIATTLTAVTTGTSASLQASSSGAITGSLTNGLVWIVSNNTPDPTKDGNAYIFVSSSIGRWYQLSGYDTSVYDNRYLKLTPQSNLGGDLNLGGNDINNVGIMYGTASWAQKVAYHTLQQAFDNNPTVGTQIDANNNEYNITNVLNAYVNSYASWGSTPLASYGIATNEFYAWTYDYDVLLDTGKGGYFTIQPSNVRLNYIDYSDYYNTYVDLKLSSSQVTVTGDPNGVPVKFGINTTSPDSNLHLVGSLKLDMQSKGAGKVLTSDADGLATWQTSSIPTLQSVTDAGNITTNHIEVDYLQTNGDVFVGRTGAGGVLEINDGAGYVGRLQAGAYLTAPRTYYLPNNDGTFALSVNGNFANESGSITLSAVTTSSFNSFTSSYNTGSFTGSFTGSLFGTASYAISSSRALNANNATFATLAITQNANNNQDYSLVFAPSGTNGYLQTYTDSNSDLLYNPSTNKLTVPIISASRGITGSLFGSSSYALTASYALNASSISTFLIATGSVTASVDVGTDTFLLKNGINTLANIKSNGNTLIGTTSDGGFKLDVNGTTRSQGKLTVSTGGATIVGDTSISGSFNVDNTNGVLTLSSGSGRTFTLNALSSSIVFGYQGNYTIQLGYDGTAGKGFYAQDFSGGPAGDYINFTGKQGNFDTIQAGQGLAANQYTALNLVGRGYSGVGPNVASINLKNSFSSNTTRMIIYDNASTGAPISILPTDGNLLVGTTTDRGYRLNVSGSGNFTNGLTVSSSLNVQGDIIPGGPYIANTSSYNLGSPTAAWKDIYVSNGSLYFVTGSVSSSIKLTGGNIVFSSPITVPSSSVVPTASFAATSSYVKLIEGNNITITYGASGITIASAAGSGGGGTGADNISVVNTTQIRLTSASVAIGNAITVPFATTASYVNGISFTSANPVLSSSYAITASYVMNSVTDTSNVVTTASFNSWTGSNASLFSGTASFAQTASLAPNYVLNSQTSSFITNNQTSSFVSNSQTSSFVINAQTSSFITNSQTASILLPYALTSTTSSMTVATASFITSSRVFGPNGANSILSSSYALTASFISPTFISASAAASGFGSGIGTTTDISGLLTTSSFNSWTGSNSSIFSGTASFAATASFINNSQFLPIVVECKIDANATPSIIAKTPNITIIGLTDGSTTVSSTNFINRQVEVFKNNILMPGINLADGTDYITKVYSSNTITFSVALNTDDYIKIKCL